jgi:hypothetical protein
MYDIPAKVRRTALHHTMCLPFDDATIMLAF